MNLSKQEVRALLNLQQEHNRVAHPDVSNQPVFGSFRHWSGHIAKYAADVNNMLFVFGNDISAEMAKKRAVDTMLITLSFCVLKRVEPTINPSFSFLFYKERHPERVELFMRKLDECSDVDRFSAALNATSDMLIKICDDVEHMDSKSMKKHDVLISSALNFLFNETCRFIEVSGWNMMDEIAVCQAEIKRKGYF